MLPKRLVMLIGGAASAIAISACGTGEHATFADNLGPGYVQVGNLNYQVQVSRELNQYDPNEDAYYLDGFSGSQRKLPTTDEWFGVSLQVYNWSKVAATPTDRFYITDTLGDVFRPIPNPSPNPYSYVPQSIPPGGQLPNISSQAYASWTSGEFLIFKVPYADLPNRPFILHIVDQADPSKQSQIELDL
jgi:hypothetical protein